MSHFSVLVIGDDVEGQLAPYHEFECTGEVDQYVVDVDLTEKARGEFAKSEERRLKAPDGTLHLPWDDQFYREPTAEESEQIGPLAGSGFGGGIAWTSRDWNDGLGYRAKIQFVPDGYEETTVRASQVTTFADWISEEYGLKIARHGEFVDLQGEHKYGYVLLDRDGQVELVVDRTNPNKKWDWYQIGGRWTGFFRLKPGAQGEIGEKAWCAEAAKPGFVDSAAIAAIDFDGMRDAAATRADGEYSRVMEAVGMLPPNESWADVSDRFPSDHDQARAAYWEQPRCAAWKASKPINDEFGPFFSPDDFLVSREEYVGNARARSTMTHAVIKDGRWYERGKMGFWACVSGEKDPETWSAVFENLLRGLPMTTRLTIVDCHI